MPELSVVVTAYNSKSTLLQCLESIKNTTFKKHELIVVDDNSKDGSALLAENFTKKVIRLSKNKGRSEARLIGMLAAKSAIVVNIDSDVVVKADILGKIHDFFNKNPEIDALTGMLSKTTPFRNFSSQYKNLYMNYIFRLLPEDVTFLYGSIFAVRKKVLLRQAPASKLGEDTLLGFQLFKKGNKIKLLKSVQVTHLKYYSLKSLVRNDFLIPFYWSGIFWKYGGWKRLGKSGVGFAHASKRQLVSVVLVPLSMIVFGSSLVLGYEATPFYFFDALWLVLNLNFFRFLFKEKGVVFAFKSLLFTFADHFIMFIGIVFGSSLYVCREVLDLLFYVKTFNKERR